MHMYTVFIKLQVFVGVVILGSLIPFIFFACLNPCHHANVIYALFAPLYGLVLTMNIITD